MPGFVFTADDPYCGVDLDAGMPAGDRAAIMLALSSYTETSVSGAGAHVIVRATLEPDAQLELVFAEFLPSVAPPAPSPAPRPVALDDRELIERMLRAAAAPATALERRHERTRRRPFGGRPRARPRARLLDRPRPRPRRRAVPLERAHAGEVGRAARRDELRGAHGREGDRRHARYLRAARDLFA